MAWSPNFFNGYPKLLFTKPWRNNSRKNSYNYALFLSKNFFISPFRISGLQSIKYKVNTILWYRNSYNLFILNNFEIYLINNNFLKALLFYPPIFRFILFKIKIIIKKGQPLPMQ